MTLTVKKSLNWNFGMRFHLALYVKPQLLKQGSNTLFQIQRFMCFINLYMLFIVSRVSSMASMSLGDWLKIIALYGLVWTRCINPERDNFEGDDNDQ
jgi:hypothetical protein